MNTGSVYEPCLRNTLHDNALFQHGPWTCTSRVQTPVHTTREYGCLKWQPCSRPMFTVDVFDTAEHGHLFTLFVSTGVIFEHGPWTRAVCTGLYWGQCLVTCSCSYKRFISWRFIWCRADLVGIGRNATAVLKIAIMFFTHIFQMFGINISGNAHIPKRSYLKELI